jgi:dihydroorotate dehydrogenase
VIYGLLFRHVLRRIDPERAHRLAAALLGSLPAGALRRVLGARDPTLRVRALGLDFPSPLGVAAGVDKDATWFEGLGAIGFGFVEIGTVTALAQPGNDPPRIERFPEARALLNWMGFPNAGAEAVAPRLARPRSTVLAVNVGKSRAAPVEQAAADYRAAVRRVAAHADVLVLNVSSPNTPGLRSLQAVEALEELVAGVQEELSALEVRVPLLVKIAPDLADEDVDAVADLAVRRGLDGLVATNTTTHRAGLVSRLRAPDEPAGVSGPPVAARSLEVLRRVHARVGERLVLVSVGGISNAEDAWERLQAGATLLQAYTGFVYGGPLWAWRVNRGLARRIRASA